MATEVQVRGVRQRRLTSEDNPLELVAIVDESVLRRPVGEPGVMGEQLARLVEAAALDRVTLQVLPTGAGAHPALTAGFTLLSFDELGIPDMAYVEYPLGAVHLEKDTDVARATLVIDRLRSLALSPADSVALLQAMIGRT